MLAGWKREITIDLVYGHVGCAILEAYQGDNRANIWSVTVLNKGVPADLSDYTVRAYFMRPDGHTIDVAGTITNNTATVELDEHVYVYLGRVSGTLVIEKTDYAITLDAMKLNILKRDTETITPDDEHFVVIGAGTLDTEAQTVVGAINELHEGVTDLEAYIAPTFDPEAATPYPAGAYVWYDGALYRFTAVHTGAWTGTDAVSVSVVGEIGELKSAFVGITGNGIIPITMKGYYLPMSGGMIDINTPTGSANFDYSLVPCSEGDVFTVNALGGSTPRAWVFIKSDGTAISPYAPGSADVTDLVLTAPANAAYLVINDKGKRQSYYGKVIKTRVSDVEAQASALDARVTAVEAETTVHETLHPYSFDTYFDTQRSASANWWINDMTYHAGYVNHVKTYIWGDTDQDVQVALVRASNDAGYTSETKPAFNATGNYIIAKLTATGHGYVTIPVNMYVSCDFWVSIKCASGLAYYQTKGAQYHYKAGSTLFDGLEGESADWSWLPENLETTLSYIIAAEVEYASGADVTSNCYPVAKTINTMFCVGDSQTAGYPYQNTASLAGVYWWNGVGRNLGYEVQQGSRSGSGWLYKSGSTNAITITNSWADRIPGFNVAVYAYGTNDYGNDIPLGTINDMWISDSEGDQTYAGAINYIISRIYEINPKIILIFATPINRSDVGSATSNYGMGHQNSDGHTLKDYCDMLIAICEKRGVMYIDRRTSAFNTGTIGSLLGDGLHPTAYGYKVLGAEMTAKLGALIHPYTDFD